MAHIDLDAGREKRRSERDPIVITFGGEKFEVEGVPLDFWTLGAKMDLDGAIVALFGGDAERFMAHKPELEDIIDLLNGVTEELGFGALGGNPTRSPGSSASTGRPSKPTSNASTASDSVTSSAGS